MANLRTKIQDLLKNTSSAEVKAICESFILDTNGKDANQINLVTESLFTNLMNYVDKDSQISTLLNEREGYEKSIQDIEFEISKKAAQKLSENWDSIRKDKKVSNVGNLIDNTLKSENINETIKNNSILEKLSASTDETAKSFVEKSKISSYLLKESIQSIKNSQISNHPNLKYVLTRFETALMENTPEYLLVKDFLSQINAFTWDSTVKASFDAVQESVNSKFTELEVQNAIHSIKSTDNKKFFSTITDKMDEWLYSDNKNIHELIKEMKSYQFNPYVKELTTKLLLIENTKGTQFNIPVKDANCSIYKIYSPVLTVTNGQVFKAGLNFYNATSDKFVKLTESQINALPKQYLELCESFFNSSIKVVDDSVIAYVGDSKIKFDVDKKIFINEKQVDSSTLGSQLMFITQKTIFRDNSNMANVVMNIYENLDNICEIDYGKAIVSNVFEGVRVYLFKKDGKIYINKVNPSMNENSFKKGNALQTVNLVREFLSFNMSESLSDFLEGDYKKKALMEGNMNNILSNIQILESELDKIEKAIIIDPSFADVVEIVEAKTLIESSLNDLKYKWQEESGKLKKFEIISEKEVDEDEEEIEIPVDDTQTVAAPKAIVTNNVSVEAPENVESALTNTEEIPTVIPGNDHLDANAAPAIVEEPKIIDAGFSGAEGDQGKNAPEISTAIKDTVENVPVITPGPENAEIIPGQIMPNEIPISVTNVDPTPLTTIEPELTRGEVEVKNVDDKDKDKVAENILETIKIDSKIIDKETGKTGTVSSINAELFSIIFSDGSTAIRRLSDIEDAGQEINKNIEKNEVPLDSIEKETALGEDPKDEAGTVDEDEEIVVPKEEGALFIKATVSIDLGPFKAGDAVYIDAANYTAAGNDDPIKLKDVKDGVTEIPKKYLKIEDEIPVNTDNDVDSKIAAVLQQISELETLIKDKNTNGSKAIEDAKEEIKKFAETIGKQEETKPKEEEKK